MAFSNKYVIESRNCLQILNTRKKENKLYLLASLILAINTFLSADTLYVGSKYEYKTPNEVAEIVKEGDVVLIAPETYINQATQWYKKDITLKAEGKYARLIAPDVISNQKAIWVLKGDKIVVENIEFQKASVPDKNGAGIRAEGNNLTVRNCYFHDNETGILGGYGTVKIEYSIFENNGFGDGYSHNLYINNTCDTLIFQYCYSHHTKIGHNLKSRAGVNLIAFNRIMDEEDGTSSYCIDLPNGGTSLILGNLLQQGKYTENSTLFSYGAEGLENPGKDCYIINNTIVNERSTGTFLRIASGAEPAILTNNLFLGNGTVLNGSGIETTNLKGKISDVIDMNKFDYTLAANSDAIDAGTNLEKIKEISLTPMYEYVHPASSGIRERMNAIDIGAHEFNSKNSIKKKIIINKSVLTIVPKFNGLSITLSKSKVKEGILRFYNIEGTTVSKFPLTINSTMSLMIPYSKFNLPAGEYLLRFYGKNINTSAYKIVIAK